MIKDEEVTIYYWIISKKVELREFDNEIQYKVFFEGEGNFKGKRDAEVLEKLKDLHIDKGLYPNLFRWHNFLQ